MNKANKSQRSTNMCLFEIFWTAMEVFLSAVGVILSFWYLMMVDKNSTIFVASITVAVITVTTTIKKVILFYFTQR